MSPNKEKVRKHFNDISPYYRDLWGVHIHHGYWRKGDESKETAQENLVKELAARADIKAGGRILDIGSGLGGSAIYLAEKFDSKVTGINLSPVQVKMSEENGKKAGLDKKIKFLEMDAEKIDLPEAGFDYLWSIEAISHFDEKKKFFERSARLLLPGGRFALIDWFKKEDLTFSQYDRDIVPIEKGMLLPELLTMTDYSGFLKDAGYKVITEEKLNPFVEKTWDITMDILQNPSVWKLAYDHSEEAVNFISAFRAMRHGYKTGSFVLGLIVGEKM